MQTILRGETLRLTTTFVDGSFVATAPGDTRVDITRPDGAQAAFNLTAGVVGGTATVMWPVPERALPGVYMVTWRPTVTGLSAVNDTAFEVALLTVQQSAALVSEVRMRIGERIPAGGTAADTLFTDEDILNTFYREGTFARTVLEMLRSKQAHYSTQVDLNESTAVRNLSQIARALDALIARYTAIVDQERVDNTAAARVAGRSVAWANESKMVPVEIERVGDVWPTWSTR